MGCGRDTAQQRSCLSPDGIWCGLRLAVVPGKRGRRADPHFRRFSGSASVAWLPGTALPGAPRPADSASPGRCAAITIASNIPRAGGSNSLSQRLRPGCPAGRNTSPARRAGRLIRANGTRCRNATHPRSCRPTTVSLARCTGRQGRRRFRPGSAFLARNRAAVPGGWLSPGGRDKLAERLGKTACHRVAPSRARLGATHWRETRRRAPR